MSRPKHWSELAIGREPVVLWSHDLAEDYWVSFEYPVAELADYMDAVREISTYQIATSTRFVWRGVIDASWALHSSLVRR